ncbi:hypothetical protein [Zhengella mangrovi]|uniref:hypothetical protein n=1 Tax=Zhengella mangrovi TaxID=1982044 RepID=UPI0010565426|nr:hypothetical protein [Zhengella mangrovi]
MKPFDDSADRLILAALGSGVFLGEPSGRVFRVVDKAILDGGRRVSIELVEVALCEISRSFDIVVPNPASEGARDAVPAAVAADLKRDRAAAVVGAGGDGPHPTSLARPVLSVEYACARLPQPFVVLARWVALYDGIAGSDDLSLHLLHERAVNIGLRQLARACADFAKSKG